MSSFVYGFDGEPISREEWAFLFEMIPTTARAEGSTSATASGSGSRPSGSGSTTTCRQDAARQPRPARDR
jgi:hypothetical protein